MIRPDSGQDHKDSYFSDPLTTWNGKLATEEEWEDWYKGAPKPEITIEQAMGVLCKALTEDTSEGYSYYYSWQANIAMSYMDAANQWADKHDKAYINQQDKHEIANIAARNFLNMLISAVKTNK